MTESLPSPFFNVYHRDSSVSDIVVYHLVCHAFETFLNSEVVVQSYLLCLHRQHPAPSSKTITNGTGMNWSYGCQKLLQRYSEMIPAFLEFP